MSIEQWPSSLPQVPQKGYTERMGANIIRSPMDAGPAKQRLRSISPNILDVSFILTTEQAEDLKTFVFTNLQGVKRFVFNHPRTQQNVEVRLLPQGQELYKVQYLAPGYWTTSMQFEIMP